MRNVLLLIHCAPQVSSGTAITEAIEVSLNSEMNVLESAGSVIRVMVGSRT
jgi:predicted protein tyrosine phosphatase